MIQCIAVLNKYEAEKQNLQQDSAVSYGTSRLDSMQYNKTREIHNITAGLIRQNFLDIGRYVLCKNGRENRFQYSFNFLPPLTFALTRSCE